MSEARRPAPPMAWVVWSLGAAYFGYAWVHRVAPSVMVDGLMREFAVGAAVLGNLSAIYFYSYAALQLPVGMLIDRWGPRRMLTLMAMLTGAGGLVFATADSLAAAYAGRFLIGAGAAFGFVGGLTLATRWFPSDRFAMLAGATMMAGMLGGMLGQGPLAVLVEAVGWRAALTGVALLGFALAASIWLVVRDHPPGAAAVAHGDAARAHSGGVFAGLGRIATRRQNWILALFGGLTSAPLLAFGGLWGVPYVMQVYGAPRAEAAFTVSLLIVGWAVGSPLWGWISDRSGRRRVPMATGAALSLLALLGVLYLPGLPLGILGGLLFLSGLGAAAMVICYAAARDINPPRAVGTAYGFVNMVVVAAGALFQPLVGWLLDLYWDGTMVDGARAYSEAAYGSAFAVLPACLALALVAVFLVGETRGRGLAEEGAA